MYQQKVLPIDSLLINILEKKGSSPTLLYIHGNSMSARIFEKQFESKLLAGFHLIGIDLPGHGGSAYSSQPDDDYNVLGYAEVLKRVINELNVDLFILIGYSLGGNVMIESLPYLNNCIGAMLVNTSIVGKPAKLDKVFLPNPALSTFFTPQSQKDQVSQLIQNYFFDKSLIIPNFLEDDFFRTDPNCRGYFAKSIGEEKYSNEIEILQNVQIPIAIVGGEQDQIINNKYLTDLPIPKWRDKVHFIPEAGHVPHWEQAHTFNQLLVDFINDCTK